MKRKFFTLAGFGLLAFSNINMACAQDDTKLRNDPTYSTHNYKHANKAAAARRWEDKSGITVQAPSGSVNQQANYKNQAPNLTQPAGVTASHTPNERLANRNYKMQQPLSDGNNGATARQRETAPKDTPNTGN